MGANLLPKSLDELFTLAEDMADGLHTHEVAVGVKQNLEAAVRAALTDCQTRQTAFITSKGTKKGKTNDQTIADSNAKAFIGKARNVLVPYLGVTWSDDWAPTGFPNQSTAVPPTLAERQALLTSLQAYFTANAAKENAPLGVTAANAGTLFTALSDARSAVNQALTDFNQKKTDRDTSERALRKRMRGLIEELTQLLDELDPRWYAFGLVPPGAPDTPDQPTGLVLSAGPPGTVYADWADAPRATGYRVETQLVGVDPDFQLFTSVSDSDATLTGLPSGATLNVRLIATNDQGDASPPSDVAQIVVP
jgi:hypothetical protein